MNKKPGQSWENTLKVKKVIHKAIDFNIMIIDSRNLIRLTQKAFAPFLIFALIGYFVYHSIQGDRGILAWLRLRDCFQKAETTLDAKVKEREALESKIICLRPDSLDRDLLDLQVREKLGYTHPDEIVILTTPAITHP